jgi:elongator complex protein 5
MELRRKSGRGVVEDFVLLDVLSSSANGGAQIVLLDEHPLYAPEIVSADQGGGAGGGEEVEEGTFSLQLTEKQKRDREGVVLPYFDAQKGGGEGGRILYEMSEVDREDFDEEEDEI